MKRAARMSDQRPKGPNLFTYSTKELSQDAMICWLIQWADAKYAGVDDQLHRCGRDFVAALLHQHDVASVPERMEVCLCQQDKLSCGLPQRRPSQTDFGSSRHSQGDSHLCARNTTSATLPGGGRSTSPARRVSPSCWMTTSSPRSARASDTGRGYQTAINRALREHLASEGLETTLRRVVREELRNAG